MDINMHTALLESTLMHFDYHTLTLHCHHTEYDLSFSILIFFLVHSPILRSKKTRNSDEKLRKQLFCYKFLFLNSRVKNV